MFAVDLPAGTALAARRVDEPWELLPEEEATLSARAVRSRRADFGAGRTAARQALQALGHGPVPIRRGPAGEPHWPDGIVGSITHASGWALALIARTDAAGGAGVDLEAADRWFPELEDEIAFGDERVRLAALDGDDRVRATVEVFAVKEAVYKAFFPRIGEFFGFDAARVEPQVGGYQAAFAVALDADYPPGASFPVEVRWFDDLVLAWLFLPRR